MKYVFFDIDGTLWDFRSVIPESTARAVKLLRENGHKAYICTGRTRGYITKPNLLSLGFDGIVSGLGTRVEEGENVLFEHLIPSDLATRTVDTVKRYGFRAILEGPEYLYMDYDEFKDDIYGKKVMRDLGERRKSLSDNYGSWVISKLSCDMTDCDKYSCYKLLENDFDFVEHNDVIAAMVPKGFSKGTGIRKLCEGVETREHLDFLKEIDCEMAQGFLFSKPKPIEDSIFKAQRMGRAVKNFETKEERRALCDAWLAKK